MCFREQARKILCIRSTYDPARKCCKQKVVASFNRAADEVPSVEVSELTAAEQQQLAVWFEARKVAKTEKLQQHQVENATTTLMQLSEAIKAIPMTDNQAALTWKALSNVAKSLRKTGHQKPKRKHRAPTKYNQADLFSSL